MKRFVSMLLVLLLVSIVPLIPALSEALTAEEMIKMLRESLPEGSTVILEEGTLIIITEKTVSESAAELTGKLPEDPEDLDIPEMLPEDPDIWEYADRLLLILMNDGHAYLGMLMNGPDSGDILFSTEIVTDFFKSLFGGSV